MTARSAELLLELLLLRQRYAPSDFRSVEEELKAFPDSEHVRRLLSAMDRLGNSTKSKAQSSSAKLRKNIMSKESFLQSLESEPMSKSKIVRVAKKIGIQGDYSDEKILLNDIKSKVKQLNDKEFSELFTRSSSSIPDEGYLKLARYLVHNK